MGRVYRMVSIALTIVVIATGVGAYGLYHFVYGNIGQEAVDEELLGPRPVKDGESVNVLIIGSDERTGDNAEYGRAEGARANVLILAHIHPDRGGATMVSFPRDSIVEMPECEPWNEFSGNPPRTARINESLETGGPPCVWRTIEQLTDIHIDHFVKMDMVGFRDIVDSIEGVPMCLPEPVSDQRAKLELAAGEQVLDGEEALAFVRARYEIGDGTDIGRVQRQQMFMSALLQEMFSRDVLSSPQRTLSMLRATTGALVTDDELTVDVMAGLAHAMREVDLGEIEFHTVPWEWSPTQDCCVEWRDEEAQRLFTAIANETTVPDQDEDGDGEGEGDGAPENGENGDTGADPDPGEVSVVVGNATGIDGLASEVAALLGERDYQVLDTATVDLDDEAAAVIRHEPDTEGHAAMLAGEIEGEVALEEGPIGNTGAVELVMTSAWSGLAPEGGADDGPPADADFTAEANPCDDGLGVGTETGTDDQAPDEAQNEATP
jgi:LCP family protein required for cell wall assembly